VDSEYMEDICKEDVKQTGPQMQGKIKCCGVPIIDLCLLRKSVDILIAHDNVVIMNIHF